MGKRGGGGGGRSGSGSVARSGGGRSRGAGNRSRCVGGRIGGVVRSSASRGPGCGVKHDASVALSRITANVRGNQLKPNNSAYHGSRSAGSSSSAPVLNPRASSKAARDNRANQMNPNNVAFHACRGNTLTKPGSIIFCQKNIGRKFQDGRGIKRVIKDLKSGRVKPHELPPIKVYKTSHDNLVTHDHRRLHCFQEAGVKNVPVKVTKDPVPSWKFDSLKRHIEVRGDDAGKK